MGSLVVLILLLCFVEVDYQRYLKEITHDVAIVEVKEGLSINYANGKDFQVSDSSETISFSVTNLTEEVVDYYLRIENVVGNTDGVTYDILESNGEEHITDDLGVTSVFSSSIDALETRRYTLTIHNPDLQTFSFSFQVDLENTSQTFADTILANNEASTTDNAGLSNVSGFIEVQDDAGDSYYFRGDVTNNYVSFANQMWRIVRINPDQTVKLVLDDVTEDMVSMGPDAERVSTSVFESSLAYTSLLQWYNAELQDYDNYVASTTYCYDDSIYTNNGTDIEYLSSYRLFTDRMPTNVCNGTSLSLKVALLTADEAMYAGGVSEGNATSYLNLDNLQGDWWTMTPSKKSGDATSYISVNRSGTLNRDVSEASTLFLRPVISLNRQVVVSGNGSLETPYMLSGN